MRTFGKHTKAGIKLLSEGKYKEAEEHFSNRPKKGSKRPAPKPKGEQQLQCDRCGHQHIEEQSNDSYCPSCRGTKLSWTPVKKSIEILRRI